MVLIVFPGREASYMMRVSLPSSRENGVKSPSG